MKSILKIGVVSVVLLLSGFALSQTIQQKKAKNLPLSVGQLVKTCLAITTSHCPVQTQTGQRDTECISDIKSNSKAMASAITLSARDEFDDNAITFQDWLSGAIPATVQVYANVLPTQEDGSFDASYEIKIVPGDHRQELLEWQKGGPGPRNFYAFPEDFLGCRLDVLQRTPEIREWRVVNAFYEDHPTPDGPLASNTLSYQPVAPGLDREQNTLVLNDFSYSAEDGYHIAPTLSRSQNLLSTLSRSVTALLKKSSQASFSDSQIYYWKGK